MLKTILALIGPKRRNQMLALVPLMLRAALHTGSEESLTAVILLALIALYAYARPSVEAIRLAMEETAPKVKTQPACQTEKNRNGSIHRIRLKSLD